MCLRSRWQSATLQNLSLVFPWLKLHSVTLVATPSGTPRHVESTQRADLGVLDAPTDRRLVVFLIPFCTFFLWGPCQARVSSGSLVSAD